MKMAQILDVCEEFFGTRDVYEIFEITKDDLPNDIKKAYLILSLKVHPDMVPDAEKERAIEEFEILSILYQILCDEDKKALYDEQGVVDDKYYEGQLSKWLDLWNEIFNPITIKEMYNYQDEYDDSDSESEEEFIDYIFNKVSLIQEENDPCIREIIEELIANFELPENKTFTEVPAHQLTQPSAEDNLNYMFKKVSLNPGDEPRSQDIVEEFVADGEDVFGDQYHKKYPQESEEADEIKKQLIAKITLEQHNMKLIQERASSLVSYMDILSDNEDNDLDLLDYFAFEIIRRKKKNTKKPSKDRLHRAKNAKVKKRGTWV